PVVAGVEGRHPGGQRDGVERHPRVVVLAHEGQRLAADARVAEGGALRAAARDADVLHGPSLTRGSPPGARAGSPRAQFSSCAPTSLRQLLVSQPLGVAVATETTPHARL